MDDTSPPCDLPTPGPVSDALVIDVLAAALRACLQFIGGHVRHEQPPCVLQGRRALQLLKDRRQGPSSEPAGA